MAQLPSLSATWREYRGWIVLLVTGFVLWSLSKVFGSASDSITTAIEGATADMREQSAIKTDEARATASAPALKKRKVSDADILKWRADARQLAGIFGTLGGNGITAVAVGMVNQDAAFSLLKLGYSRLTLYENKPLRRNPKTGKMESQSRETADSLKNPVNWTVLVPFYKDVTGGNDLRTDIRKYLQAFWLKGKLAWVI